MFHKNPITYQKNHIKYKICFDRTLGLNAQDKAHLRSTVKSILDDDNDWKKYGFNFTVGKKGDVDLYIELASPEKIYNTCNFVGFWTSDWKKLPENKGKLFPPKDTWKNLPAAEKAKYEAKLQALKVARAAQKA